MASVAEPNQAEWIDKPSPESEEADDHEDEDGEEEDEDDESDGDSEEDFASRLNNQLWADISAAQAALASHPTHIQTHSYDEKANAAIATMKTILAILDRDPFARDVLRKTCLPDAAGQNVLDLLTGAAATGSIQDGIASTLSTVVRSLAESDALTVAQSDTYSSALNKGKRKRTEEDEGLRASKKIVEEESQDLQTQISIAIHKVQDALRQSTPDHALTSQIISSIQPQLYQIYLFAVTAAAISSPQSSALQELSGLIQVIGVVSGVPISASSSSLDASATMQVSDVGTAVYPCLEKDCGKTFSRLFSLRTHHPRAHPRPDDLTHKCDSCEAAFARNADLKKHQKIHEKKAWKCSGCDKIFARRDGIRRHLKTAANRGDKGVKCVAAEAEEIDPPEEQTRKAIEASITNSRPAEGVLEEGEIPQDIIHLSRTDVLELQTLLSERVSGSLGKEPTSADSRGDDQTTLASVIARVQSSAADPATQARAGSLSFYGLSEEQAQMLEKAIANAASAAQAQAEAEAQQEEDGEGVTDDEEGEEGSDS